MVKVRVTDLRFVAVALLLLASLTAAVPVKRKSTNPPWHNPCDVAFSGKTRRQAPHESQQINNRPLVTQLKITRDSFCDEWGKVAPMYSEIVAMKKKFHNLPTNTLSWYNRVKSEDPEKKNNVTLHRLHVNLQHFLIGLESMKLTDDLLIEDDKLRDNFFHKVSSGAKLLLCEVETFVNISNVQKPEPQPAYDPCLDELVKNTAVLLGCEKSFFNLYSSFLDDLNTIFDKNSRRSSKRCSRHRQKKGTMENRKPMKKVPNKQRHKKELNRTGAN